MVFSGEFPSYRKNNIILRRLACFICFHAICRFCHLHSNGASNPLIWKFIQRLEMCLLRILLNICSPTSPKVYHLQQRFQQISYPEAIFKSFVKKFLQIKLKKFRQELLLGFQFTFLNIFVDMILQ